MRFELDEAGLERLLSAGQAERVARDAAQAIVDEAERIAPHGFMGYRDHLDVGEAHTLDGVVAVDAVADSPGWHLVEFGSANNVPHRVLERAARNVGIDFRER